MRAQPVGVVGTRYLWVDVAKGVCMALVVLRHLSLWFEGQINPGDAAIWWTISEILSPLRMPLFFFLSGFLAVRALSRPLRASQSRTLGLYVLYALWTFLFLARLFIPAARGGGDAPTAPELALSLILPTSFWYLWALPAFFLLSWALMKVMGRHAAWALVPLLALSTAGQAIEDATLGVLTDPMDALKLGSVSENAVWFFLGVVGRPLWLAAMERASVVRLVVGVAGYVAAYIALGSVDLLGPGKVLLAAIALWTSLQALAVLDMETAPMRAFAAVGRMTLPVYIFHIFAISAMSGAVSAVGVERILAEHAPVWGAILPPVLAVIVILACRLVGGWILGSRARWLLEPRAWLPTGRPAPSESFAAHR
jgi:uncharacterized membrane protein YcfT